MKLRWPFATERRVSGFVDRFVANDLSAILASIGRPSAVKIERFAAGRSSTSVRHLILADGASLVLRAHFAASKNRKCQNHWHLMRYLSERGFRVPRVHFRQVFPFPRGKADVEILIEDFVEGHHVAQEMQDDATLRHRLVETFLSLHGDLKPWPGRPWIGKRSPDPLVAALNRAPSRFDRIRRALGDSAARQIEPCLKWFRENLARRTPPDSYELIHGDCNPLNFIVTPDGHIAMADVDDMVYGCFEADLVQLRWSFFDEHWWSQFCREYFEAAPARRERFDRTAHLFSAAFFLTKASRQAASIGRATKKRDRQTAEHRRAKCRRYWHLLLQTVHL
ncbi:aminoglycoside phosphotransferase family protein [Candidatus Sumerlaeota bacterium]|nr:aminoglycoside phosphotransferase family protein [Candidatus Sumerlaeota bacterium]